MSVDMGKLASAFVGLADTLVDDFDVVDLLYELVYTCVDVLDAAAAGLLLASKNGQLHVIAASRESARVLELFQIQNQEGPCLDCFRSGSPVRTERLDSSETRWPQYGLAASEQGYVRALALPMRLRGQVVGALNLLGDNDAPSITEQAIPVAQAMADVATIAILTDRLASSRDLLNEQLHVALDSRVVIEQAKGTLATRLDIDHDEAFVLLHRRARSQRRPLREVAAEVTATRPEGDWQQFRSLRAERPDGNPADG
jgi:GAF domain-containing protein